MYVFPITGVLAKLKFIQLQFFLFWSIYKIKAINHEFLRLMSQTSLSNHTIFQGLLGMRNYIFIRFKLLMIGLRLKLIVVQKIAKLAIGQIFCLSCNSTSFSVISLRKQIILHLLSTKGWPHWLLFLQFPIYAHAECCARLPVEQIYKVLFIFQCLLLLIGSIQFYYHL